MCRTSPSLLATWRYRDMVATSSTVATRRIDRAASPSASATSIAARTIRSRLRSGWSRVVSRRLGTGIAAVATTVPTPGITRTSPSRRNAARTLVAVAIATPHSWVIRRTEGTRSPGRSSPASIRRRTSCTIRRYGGLSAVTVLVHHRTLVVRKNPAYGLRTTYTDRRGAHHDRSEEHTSEL